jgi:hypothetical protein
MKRYREEFEAWYYRADSHTKTQAVMVACFVVLTVYTIIMGIVKEARS